MDDVISESELYEIAFNFRKAIQEVIRDGDIDDVNLRRFPNGCCSYTSDLLQRFFF